MVTKKSEAWTALITTSSADNEALAASLACEEVVCTTSDSAVTVSIRATSASDLRAKYNSTMRSLRAANDTLQQIHR